ncbi:peroxiredoxin [Pseudonocardia alni]|jgi:peroxiredoxin Q/BCP|uniref:peroxiredoxin n=1 Tax=Pseudonocardia alni TaxID=33907 RepID=UPI003407AC56
MAVGDTATDFELPDEAGAPRRLSDLLAAGPVVLFFYPAAMTGGCTAEACHFRDLAAEFAEVGAQPVGISSDRPDKQNMFAAANGLGFPLLSDADHAVAKSFGAYRAWLPGNFHTRRRTFVIGPDRAVLAEIGSETDMNKHADEALALLRERAAA